MQLAANQQLVRNRARLGAALHIGALVAFAVGLLISLRLDASTLALPIVSWLTVVLGLVLYTLGQSQLRRWGPRHRQEEQLGQAIRSLDDRYKLYAFLSSRLPDYVLVSPAGVHVLVARHDEGQISCLRDHWKRAGGIKLLGLLEPSLGNPGAEAQRDAQRIRALLAAEGITDVPTAGLVVFTNPKAQLRVEGCSVTVTRLKELKDVLRRAAGRGRNESLSAARIRELHAFFDRRMRAAPTWR